MVINMLNFYLETLIEMEDIMRYGIVATAIVLLILIFILFYFLVIVRRRYKKQSRDLQKRYQESHETLVGNIEQGINRLDTIAHLNLMYIQIHEDYSKRYHLILENNDKQSFIAVTSLMDLISEKKYRRIKGIIESTRETINEFIRVVDSLNSDLNELLQKDEKGRAEAVILQRQFRDIKENYLSHSKELESVAKSYQKLFSKIEEKFVEFENLSNSAQYQESEEKLPLIGKILKALDEAIKVMPSYCSLTEFVIPKRIEELLLAHSALESEDYPLHHLKVKAQVDEFNMTLNEVRLKLSEFRLDGIKESLDHIEDQIVSILASFEKEKETKKYFDENFDSIYNHSYVIEKKFMKLKRNIPIFKDVYAIKDRYLDDIDNLQNDINRLGDIKRDLDTYVHSSTRQPYSILVMKLADLDGEMKRIEDTVEGFQNYLNSLKRDTETAYRILGETFLLLKKKERVIREMDIEAFSRNYVPKINRAYTYLERIDEVLKVQPIDVEVINENRHSLETIVDELKDKVEKESAALKYAEESLVYSNQYRQEFADVRKDLSIAEKNFFDADFDQTLNQTMEILKKMRPAMHN